MKLRFLLIFFFIQTLSIAQTRVLSSSGYGTGDGNIIFSVGDILSFMDIEETPLSTTPNRFDVKVYSNPVQDHLTIEFDEIKKGEKTSIIIYEKNGNLIKDLVIDDNRTTIDLRGLPPSIYFMKVFNESRETKVIKLIKN